MKPPIIIDCDGDVYFYETLKQAEQDIEPPDVRNDIYVIYDCEGLILKSVVVEDSTHGFIKIYESDEYRQIELRETLIDFFAEIGHDSLILETINTENLINLGFT